MSFRINTNVTAINALRNLGMTGQSFAKSVNRLSTGLKINSAADDPSGLIFSENFRAQISGVDAAIRNNQDAINYTKTAEGALDEISNLLRDARSLAVQSANTAVLSSDQLQANQTQMNLIAESINRIASQTQFGTKKLLDGSSGVNGSVIDAAALKSITLSGTFDGTSLTTTGTIGVNVTTAATKGSVSGTRTVAAASEAAYLGTAVGAAAAGNFSINGFQFTVAATDTWGQVIDKVNAASGSTGVVAQSNYSAGNGSIVLNSTTYGKKGDFTLADSGVLLSAAGSSASAAVDAVADVTIGGQTVTFNGGKAGNDGLTVTDTEGNRIVLTETASGNYASAGFVNVGSAQFQTGGNANQTSVLSIGNFSASTLGFNNLDLTSQTGATAAIMAIDAAISNLSDKRGEIGSFQRNILESNVRSLGIAKENLSATESAVRDTDIAEEMTNYTKLQILQQSGLAVLAQANQAPQSVLSLLRG
ncbi:MAG: hypothetical protein KF857_10790 [Fimbriimonadaceae bacterium]|nr:hypothetical protein [Fimbriimonadaceae bacterium]